MLPPSNNATFSLLLTKSKARPWKAIIGNRIQDSNIAISDKLSDL